MRLTRAVLTGFVALLLVQSPGSGQTVTGVPFLLLTSSPEGNGMGGISPSTASGDPMAILDNPGQLGLSSLHGYFSGGFTSASPSEGSRVQNQGMSYAVSAFDAGIELNRLLSLPLRIGLGVGYAHASFDPGEPPPSMLMLASPPVDVHWKDRTDNWSIGVGIEYVLQLGLGFTRRSVVSEIVSPQIQGLGAGIAQPTTYDLGLTMVLPVVQALRQVMRTEPGRTFEPRLDIGFTYAGRNLGDERVAYWAGSTPDPLPRNVSVGVSLRTGLMAGSADSRMEVISLVLARDAEDILVEYFPAPADSAGNVIGAPTWQYLQGSGAIRFWNNVILGEGGGDIILRKGWELNLAEAVSVRGGSVEGAGGSYISNGYGVRLTGILRFLRLLSPTLSASPVMAFAIDHLDIGFDHSSTSAGARYDLNQDLTYDGFRLSVR